VLISREFHHALRGLFHHGRIGFNDGRLPSGPAAKSRTCMGKDAGRLVRAFLLPPTRHIGSDGNRQTFVVTEKRGISHPCFLTRLNERIAPFDFGLPCVNDDLAAYRSLAYFRSSVTTDPLDFWISARPNAQ